MRAVRWAVVVAGVLGGAPSMAAAAEDGSCLPAVVSVAPGASRAVPVQCLGRLSSGGRLTAEVASPPAHGTVSAADERTGTLRYTPAAGYSGKDRFLTRVRGQAGRDEPAPVDVEVTTADQPPVCFPVAVRQEAAYGITTPVVCDDPDEADAVALEIVDGPVHGTARPNASTGFVGRGASLLYDPVQDFAGTDRITVRASSSGRTSAPVDVTVVVTAPEAPTCTTPPLLRLRTGAQTNVPDPCGGIMFPAPGSLAVVDEPAHGEVVRTGWGFGPLAYTPNDGYLGPDSFTLQASNAAGASEVVRQDVLVTTEDTAPVCQGGPADRVRAGGSVNVSPFCTDQDDDPLQYTTTATHGAVATSDQGGFPTTTFTADTGFEGLGILSTTASDGTKSSNAARTEVRIIGPSVNTPPTCVPFGEIRLELPQPQGSSSFLPVSCTDDEGDALTYTVTQPAHGSVDPVEPSFIFAAATTIRPEEGYRGTDSFTIGVSDGRGGSRTLTVPLRSVDAPPAPAPSAPTCAPRLDLEVRPGRAVGVHPNCQGAVGNPAVETQPAHGTVGPTFFGNDLVYTPSEGFTGTDTFSVSTKNDVGTTVVPVSVAVTEAANRAPSCFGPYDPVTRSAPVVLEVSCSDGDGDPVAITFGAPAHGTLSAYDQEARTVTYTPASGYVGKDSFTVDAADDHGGRAERLVQGVRVRTADGNARPTCNGNGVTVLTEPGRPVGLTSGCTDRDGDPLTYVVTAPPAHGSIEPGGFPGSFTYTPAPGFTGTDGITVVADDGRSQSLPARLGVQVQAPSGGPGEPSPPACRALSANVTRDVARPLTLSCTDPVGATGGFAPQVLDPPQHGTLSAVGEDGVVTYTPAPGYVGPDAFSYRAVKGTAAGAAAPVSLEVAAPAAQPAAAPVVQARAGAPSAPPATAPEAPSSAELVAAAKQQLGGGATFAPDLVLGPVAAFRLKSPAQTATASKVLALACTTLRCTVKVTKDLRAGKRKLKLPTQRAVLATGEAAAVTVKLPRGVRAKLGGASKATLVLAITVKDGAGGVFRDELRAQRALPAR